MKKQLQKNTAKLKRAGFNEKQVTLPDGTLLNYGEGPAGGDPLFLIHGQMVLWQDYHKVLAELAKSFHVFAIDCHGHGQSCKDPKKYTCKAMGEDFLWFIKEVITKPVIVSGHSSGGLLTAWLGANGGSWVRGIVIEDAPFFSTLPKRLPMSYAGKEFAVVHDFLNQSEEPFYARYHLHHAYMKELVGEKPWTNMIIKPAERYWKKHPGVLPKIWYLPRMIQRVYQLSACWQDQTGYYDLRFGDAFYTQSWFEGFDQIETMKQISCPNVLLHTAAPKMSAPSYFDQNGVLLAAMSAEDALNVHSLILNNELIDGFASMHDIHEECPQEFVKVLNDFKAKLAV
ncbi:MAG: alpha/beta hydrolase [Erysipelotrichaceae bacterium]|jgi:pimeloyl-ACP methyl ester carboxylesterase|nr:alpha/beta hydrolase [Erysipelotrichaceae bacterium]